MWQLGFDNGITSAGFSLDPAQYALDENVSPDAEWDALLARYPSILQQFERATLVQPLVRTGRMQRRLSHATGEDWVALPHTAGFVDPWLSSGIAITLYGVERVARLLADFAPAISSKSIRGSAVFAQRLRAYEQSLSREVAMMDRVSAACLARFDCFPVVAATTMVYFAAVTFAEERCRRGEGTPEDEFLLTHDDRFVSIAEDICGRARSIAMGDAEAFARYVARAIEPYNTIGLCDPAARNMYPYAQTRE